MNGLYPTPDTIFILLFIIASGQANPLFLCLQLTWVSGHEHDPPKSSQHKGILKQLYPQ